MEGTAFASPSHISLPWGTDSPPLTWRSAPESNNPHPSQTTGLSEKVAALFSGNQAGVPASSLSAVPEGLGATPEATSRQKQAAINKQFHQWRLRLQEIADWVVGPASITADLQEPPRATEASGAVDPVKDWGAARSPAQPPRPELRRSSAQ